MKRLLFVAENREETSLRKFFLWLGPERSAFLSVHEVVQRSIFAEYAHRSTSWATSITWSI